MQIFRTPVPPAAGGFAPEFPVSGGCGLRHQIPKTAPHRKFLATRLNSNKQLVQRATKKLENEWRKKSFHTDIKVQNQHFRYLIHTGN